MKIWVVDAFTNTPFKGNPAGVCLLNKFLETEVMQAIAHEMNLSQVAFVVKNQNSHYHIRWFSPLDEAPLCGHATLAAAHIIWQNSTTNPLNADNGSLFFRSFGGPLTACLENNTQSATHQNSEQNNKYNIQDTWIALDFPEKLVVPCALPNLLQRALKGVSIQSVYKDELTYLVVLSKESDVLNLKPNHFLISKLDCRAVIVTSSSQKADYDFVSRYFAPKVGIYEDPVCGSSYCRLTPFWAKVLKKSDLRAYQGSKRGGDLKLNYKHDRVIIKGQAVTMGTFDLDDDVVKIISKLEN